MKIMKKNIFAYLIIGLLVLSGCDYNEKNFPGYNDNPITDIVKMDYTLTDADYATIANNSTNKALAEKDGVSTELKAVASNFCFSSVITAEDYAPAFLAAKWYTADEGSAIKLTYNQSVAAPEYLSQIDAAETYILTADDYASVLDKDNIDYFYPSKPAATYLPRILRAAMTDAVDGQYLAVEYNYSSQDPSTGGEEENPYNSITDAVEGPNGDYFVKGTVAAIYSRGFLLTDGTAIILVYNNALTNVNLGDEVTVKGTTTVYGGAKQFGQTGLEITRLSGATTFAYPTATAMTAAEMDTYVANATSAAVKYVTYTGKLSISNNKYFNIAIDGASTAIGSIANPCTGFVSPELDGKDVVITGYTVGTSSGKYVNTMATSIAEVGATAPTSIGVVQLSDPGEFTVQGQVMAVNSRSFLINDGTNTIMYYKNALPDVEIGAIVSVTGTTSAYGGLKQFPNSAEYTVITDGTGSTTYPTAYDVTIDDIDAYADAPYARYISVVGELTISGNYYNLSFPGASVGGSITYPISGSIDASLSGQQVLVTGYCTGSTGSAKYYNIMATSVEAVTATTRAAVTRAANAETVYVMYQYNGGIWSAAESTAMVSPSDYSQMGLSNNNFSSTYKPSSYVPQFLASKYPYAQPDQTVAAVYYYYNGTTTELASAEYTYTSGAWVENTNIEVMTDQFVFDGTVWNYDPSIVIVLKKGDTYTKEFMQVTVDGVKEHMGSEYIDSYGTAEFYYGCSAYYGNVDITPAKWKGYAPYAGMTDAEISDVIVEHAKSGIFVYSLQYYHGDLDVIPGIDVTVTITYDTYNSAASAGVNQIKYLVTGKGQFEYIEGSFQVLE